MTLMHVSRFYNIVRSKKIHANSYLIWGQKVNYECNSIIVYENMFYIFLNHYILD